jgi:hypothetical protein
MRLLRKLWRRFLARFRLDLRVVCEESAGRGPCDDYHDYDDTAEKQPWHFTLLKCERCGKEFYL